MIDQGVEIPDFSNWTDEQVWDKYEKGVYGYLDLFEKFAAVSLPHPDGMKKIRILIKHLLYEVEKRGILKDTLGDMSK